MSTLIKSWRFSSTLISQFKNASKDAVLQSDRFDHDGCRFYIECTPNGFSDAGSKEGECTLWLAVETLPDDIAKLDITIRFVCDEISYDTSRRSPKLGGSPGCSWSVGMLNPPQNTVFNNRSSWSFKCYVTIHEKIKKTESDQMSLDTMLQLLTLLKSMNQQELKEVVGDDQKSDSGLSDIDDLLNDDEKGFAYVADGYGKKLDLPWDATQSVVSLKQDFAEKICCDPDELQILALVNGEIVEVEHQTLTDNKINDPKDIIVFPKEDRKEAVKRMLRANWWKKPESKRQAKDWLKQTGNQGKQGIDNLITKNGLNPGWNDVLSKLDYNNVLKIIRDDSIMSKIDRIRVDKDERRKYNISNDQVIELTYAEIAKMHTKTTALREKFYEDMSKAALKGTDMGLNPDCATFFDQFKPGDKGTNGKTIGFFGIICLIDGKDLKAMGIPCKKYGIIKKGQVYVYPSEPHNKNIKLGEKTENGSYVNPSLGGTGHQQLCDKAGLPRDYCAGFAITPPKLKFRSGTCNASKYGKIKGFDNKRALSEKLQDCLKDAFNGTAANKFYDTIDHGN
mmetsp:Transcript_30989/g.27293  ORF Transcript_30989/g.27293 Transcript_30989/m.27293 type:complete len:565 (+) Transcript_30989:27-1721(+)